MTTTQNPRLLASANTIAGFAIGIIETADLKGSPIFEVVRMDRHSRFVTITRHADEAGARRQANIEYRADRKAA